MEWAATIIVGVLACIGTITGAYLANKKQSALIAYRLEQLENKVQAHNNLIERTYKIEERLGVVDEQIKVVNNRLKDLERAS